MGRPGGTLLDEIFKVIGALGLLGLVVCVVVIWLALWALPFVILVEVVVWAIRQHYKRTNPLVITAVVIVASAAALAELSWMVSSVKGSPRHTEEATLAVGTAEAPERTAREPERDVEVGFRLLRSGDLTGARAAYQRALGGGDDAKARWGLARTEEIERGDLVVRAGVLRAPSVQEREEIAARQAAAESAAAKARAEEVADRAKRAEEARNQREEETRRETERTAAEAKRAGDRARATAEYRRGSLQAMAVGTYRATDESIAHLTGLSDDPLHDVSIEVSVNEDRSLAVELRVRGTVRAKGSGKWEIDLKESDRQRAVVVRVDVKTVPASDATLAAGRLICRLLDDHGWTLEGPLFVGGGPCYLRRIEAAAKPK